MKPSPKPLFSVVVPAYNEEKYLSLCLASLVSQNFPKTKYEVIVVDNGSTDKTTQIAKKYKVRLIKESRKGVVFARQTGFLATRGKIICSTDADCFIPSNWLKKIASTFKKNPDLIAIGGNLDLMHVDNFFKLMIKFFAPPGLFLDQLLRLGSGLYSPNFAIKKSVFLKIGGFDTSLLTGEDLEISKRARKAGQIRFLNNLKVQTSARRFEQGFKESFKYVVLNYISVNLFSKSYLKQFKEWR